MSLPRRTVVTGLGVGALAAAAGLRPTTATPAAPAVAKEVDVVDHFAKLRLNLIEHDNLFGSSQVIPMMERAIASIGQLRNDRRGDPNALQRMRILYAEGSAWLHQDLRSFDRAQYWTDRALEWSHRLGDQYCIAAVLIRKAQIANDQGDGFDAIELAESADRAAPAGTRFSAVASVFAGYGAALTGDRAGSDRAFDRARVLLHDNNVDPSWGFFLDDCYIDVHQAHARAALGDHRGAADDFATAIAGMRSEYTRDQAVYLGRQANAYARAGEIDAAASLANSAMQVGVSTGSERVLTNVRSVAESLDPRSRAADIQQFLQAAKHWEVIA